MLGTNHDDAIKMLEKYSESAGTCDNNQRKRCQNHGKMKETGKKFWKNKLKLMKMQETRGNGVKIIQKPTEERGENGRKHVVKKCWTKHIENP